MHRLVTTALVAALAAACGTAAPESGFAQRMGFVANAPANHSASPQPAPAVRSGNPLAAQPALALAVPGPRSGGLAAPEARVARNPISATQVSNGLAPPQSGQGQVIARGTAGVLTYDNAAAFYEAFLFSLQQVSAQRLAANITKDQFITTVGQAFPKADIQSQQALVNARAIWQQVQTAWPTAQMDDKREFVHGVIALAMGPQAAGQLTGATGQQGGNGGGGSVGGISPDVPNPAGGCWASAGCESYDPVGGYTYEAPPTDY